MQRHGYDVQRMLDDMAAKVLNPIDVARAGQMAPSTVTRFLSGQRQTVKTAKRIADVLGYSVRRYLVSAKATAVNALHGVPETDERIEAGLGGAELRGGQHHLAQGLHHGDVQVSVHTDERSDASPAAPLEPQSEMSGEAHTGGLR